MAAHAVRSALSLPPSLPLSWSCEFASCRGLLSSDGQFRTHLQRSDGLCRDSVVFVGSKGAPCSPSHQIVSICLTVLVLAGQLLAWTLRPACARAPSQTPRALSREVCFIFGTHTTAKSLSRKRCSTSCSHKNAKASNRLGILIRTFLRLGPAGARASLQMPRALSGKAESTHAARMLGALSDRKLPRTALVTKSH